MSPGVRLTDKDSSSLVQGLFGLRKEPTTKVVHIPVDDLSQQLLGGPIGDAINAAAIGLNWKDAGWVSGTAYVRNDALSRGNASYRCILAHTASALTEPGVGANWATYWVVLIAADAGLIGAKTDQSDTTKLYRDALGWYTGDFGAAASYPSLVTGDNRVVEFTDLLTGSTLDYRTSIATYRANLGAYYGDTDVIYPVTLVSQDNRVLATAENMLPGGTGGSATAREPDTFGYVSAGDLRAIGGAAGDRLLNGDAGKTWVAADRSKGSVQAVYSQGDLMHLVRVGVSGDVYFDGEWTGWVSYGQSNAEAQSGIDTVLMRTVYPYASRLMMPFTAAANVWLGLVTTAGASIQLAANAITGMTPLKGSLGDSTHGTTSIESAALRQCSAADLDCSGLVPQMVVWTGAEGGQDIANLSKGAPAGKYGYSNMVSAVTQLKAKLPAGERLVMRWMEMVQGEQDTADAALGDKHDAVRADFSADFALATGQNVPLRMVSFQPSSWSTNSEGVRSILARHLTTRAAYGTFLCGGPTYPFPFTDDFLHATSLGHDQRGELLREIIRTAERTGYCDPLYMLSATITATSQITVTLSQSAAIDTSDPFVAAIENAGITVPGKTVTNVAVSGTSMVITVSGAAAGATSVQAALIGQSTGTRTAERIPRTNIRSVANLGTYRSGRIMRKWMAHQQIAIS